jgi:hypothetical protein
LQGFEYLSFIGVGNGDEECLMNEIEESSALFRIGKRIKKLRRLR